MGLRLAPGHKMARGKAAKRGPVAWNQSADGSIRWPPPYNTCRPFHPVAIRIVKRWRWVSPDPDSVAKGNALIEWMREMEEKRDWREVEEEKLDRLDAICEELIDYGLWHLRGGKAGVQPFGAKSPYCQASTYFVTAAADMRRCISIARVRIHETKNAAYNRDVKQRQLNAAIDAAEVEQRMKDFDEKTKPRNGDPPA